MVNLMENASNYGGGAREIAVGPSGDDQVLITVDDAGPGIDPAERSKVFDRFYRGSASGRRGTGTGSGLGLALVAEHMRLMGGQRAGRDLTQGGARLVLTLPVISDDEPSVDEEGGAA